RLALLNTDPVLVHVDAMRIRQVVTNYLTNALKYSKEDRAVEVRLEVEYAGARVGGGVGASAGDVARVRVRDEGIGVPLAAQASIWDRFEQIEGNKVQSGSGIGLGIGLAISKHVVEGHHGQVGIESVPMRGSTFWFTMPCISRAPVVSAPENSSSTAQ